MITNKLFNGFNWNPAFIVTGGGAGTTTSLGFVSNTTSIEMRRNGGNNQSRLVSGRADWNTSWRNW